MSSKLTPQLPLLIVHLATVGTEPFPAVTPVIVVLGEDAFVITPGPDWIVQVPTPTTGVLAAIAKVLVLHWSIFIPASAIVALALLVSTTSEVLGVHTPLLIVQRNVALVPTGTPVTPLLLAVGAVIVAVPLTKLQLPVPLTGTFPASVKLPFEHCSWLGPATETLGAV